MRAEAKEAPSALCPIVQLCTHLLDRVERVGCGEGPPAGGRHTSARSVARLCAVMRVRGRVARDANPHTASAAPISCRNRP